LSATIGGLPAPFKRCGKAEGFCAHKPIKRRREMNDMETPVKSRHVQTLSIRFELGGKPAGSGVDGDAAV
jgi:hypothetical protein